MSVLRNSLRNKFTIIENDLIENKEISHAAFRVACYLLSRPDHWQINNADIQNRLGIKETKTLSGYWKELMKAGVLFRKAKPKFKGKFQGFDYAIGTCPDGWESENLTVGGSATIGSAVNGSTHQHSNTENSNTKDSNTERNDSFQESGTPSEGTCLHMATSKQDSMECGSQNKAKPKKTKPKRLKASQIDRDQYPHTAAAIRGLTISLKGHENSGQTHKFALSGKNRELTVAENHLPVIEFNLSELARFHHLDKHQVVATLLNIYNERFKHRESCNLAVLAGVNLGMNRERYGAEEMDYVEWVTDCELVA